MIFLLDELHLPVHGWLSGFFLGIVEKYGI
jgi:hypothetical protein